VYLHLHGAGLARFYADSSKPMRLLIRSVFGQAHEAWALTAGLQSQFDGLVPDGHVRWVSNVVDDPDPDLESRRSSRGADGLNVLYLANLLPEKGCFELIAALHLIGKDARNWTVRLVGPASRDVERELRAQIAALPKQSAQVELVGEATGQAKHLHYQWADVFVYPTYYPPEGQPLVLLEALGAGLPVIATRWAAIPETVIDGETGVLVPPHDRPALAGALRRLASNLDLRDCMALAARERYLAVYGPARLERDLRRVLSAVDD
jgi:glycosyltransferase involved in cell wall biosynthesis